VPSLLRPPVEDMPRSVSGLLLVAGGAAGTLGTFTLLDDTRHLRASAHTAPAALLVIGVAPVLLLLSDAVLSRTSLGRRATRVALPAIVLALTASWWRSGTWPGLPVLAGLVTAWVWPNLGRADVRAAFVAWPGWRDTALDMAWWLAGAAIFVAATLGAGIAIAAGPRVGLPAGWGAVSHHVGALGCGLVTLVGLQAAWRLWRGPDAHLDLVAPEAWARIVAEHQGGRTAPAILDGLVEDGVPPPGRRWTVAIVDAVLRANDPACVDGLDDGTGDVGIR
jgi:hypothetical protein